MRETEKLGEGKTEGERERDRERHRQKETERQSLCSASLDHGSVCY